MNWVDIVIIVLIVGLGFLGFRNGLIRWALTLIGGIVGVVLAGRLYKTFAPAVPFGDSDSIKQIIAFAAILLIVMIAAWIAARLLKSILTVLMLGWIDGAAGALVGIVAGALAATALVSVMGAVPLESSKKALQDSAIAKPLVRNVGIVLAFLPREFDSVKGVLGIGDQQEDQQQNETPTVQS